MLTLAVLMALTAVVMSTIKLTAPAPTATTTTVMAPPPPPTSFSPDQLAAAKKEACHASESAATTINTAQEKYLIAARDRQSPTYGPALANFQLVAIAIVLAMLLGGLRAGEVRRLLLADVDQGRRQLRVVGKGGRERVVPVDDAFFAELASYLSHQQQ
ncbi:site-specific integrase [Mycobacterium ulcerans]|uniref:site-specific integrase n=1 Tax=Mycobacterium ulcerans TaxID=1809 RepID=UPI001E41D2FE|nr:site-specific integrase [Mycobacterium ulcerans]